MLVSSLTLHDFRSYDGLDCDFEPGVNVLVGPNGVGKTNLVEAIRYTSVLSSHRVSGDGPLRKANTASAVIRVAVSRRQQTVDLELAINEGKANRLQIAGSPARSRDFVGQLRSVMFGPEDLRIVKGDPSDRREYLDDVLIQRAPRYLAVKADYERVVRQRTSLLKTLYSSRRSSSSTGDAASTLGVWNEQLATTGASLLYGRLRVLDELTDPVIAAYRDISNGSKAALSYSAKSLGPEAFTLPRNRDELAQILREAIEVKASEELARGLTLIGPHRDDVSLVIDQLPAKTHASHGESWSLALALRLGAFELLRQFDDAGDPVLILDDVFAELDTHRRAALRTVAEGAEQVFITAAVAGDVPTFSQVATFTVEPGTVTRVRV